MSKVGGSLSQKCLNYGILVILFRIITIFAFSVGLYILVISKCIVNQ